MLIIQHNMENGKNIKYKKIRNVGKENTEKRLNIVEHIMLMIRWAIYAKYI